MRRLRRLAGYLLLFAPTAWVVGTDVIRRLHYIQGFDRDHRKGYAASIVESLVFWSVVLYAGSRRRGPASTSTASVANGCVFSRCC